MTHWPEITYPALSKRYALQFVQIVNLRPNLIKTYKLNSYLLWFFNCIQKCLCIIFNFMNLLCHSFLNLLILYLLCFILQLFFDLFEILVNIFSMMKLLCFKVSLKQCRLQTISKLNLIVFNHWSLILGTLEVLKSTNSTIMLPPTEIIPFNTNPKLILTTNGLSSVLQVSEISNDTTAIIEKNFPSNELLVMIIIVRFESLRLCLKIVWFLFAVIFFEIVRNLNFRLSNASFNFIVCGSRHRCLMLWEICLCIFHYIDFKFNNVALLKN